MLFILYKHLIGIEPIIFCFEGNRFTDLAKDVKLFKNLINLPFYYTLQPQLVIR